MTEGNYQYRTSQTMLRNQFDGDGRFQIPIIPKSAFHKEDFDGLLLIGFDRARKDDTENQMRMVHFFLYDYKFERIWRNPEQDIERLQNYQAVLSPDFSMYLEMNPTMQLYNTFRNRWCGAYWASKGMRVIPTVSWGDSSTFDFCFLGIPKGSTVAVSTYMVSEHDNRCDQKDFFMAGYREMLNQIEPERIICYNTPFPEMEGNIVYVDYELSSWKYQKEAYIPSPYVKYITGALPLPENSGIVIKRGCILPGGKGMGSAHGGKWRPNPNKPDDQRFLGKPGEIKTTIIKNGDTYRTKIGQDGRAEWERHETDHGKPWAHSNPHDHEIKWNNPQGFPNPQPPINYPDEVPEFKLFAGIIQVKTLREEVAVMEHFDTISGFKDCMHRHGEVLFRWSEKEYSITHYDGYISIAESYKRETEHLFTSVEDLLEYPLGGQLLKEIITQVEVVTRTV